MLRALATLIVAGGLSSAAIAADIKKPRDTGRAGKKAGRPKPASAKPKPQPPPQPEKPVKSIADTPPAEAASAVTSPSDEGRSLQRGERIEFDARLIQGQTAKAGAVYLFERVRTDLKSMVKERASFRDKVVRKVFLEKEADR